MGMLWACCGHAVGMLWACMPGVVCTESPFCSASEVSELQDRSRDQRPLYACQAHGAKRWMRRFSTEMDTLFSSGRGTARKSLPVCGMRLLERGNLLLTTICAPRK